MTLNVMGPNLTLQYVELLYQLSSNKSCIPEKLLSDLNFYSMVISRLDEQDGYSKPMPWIGMYIASASFFCTLAMVADLIHGLRNKKLWFPCKYFTINAASLTVIAVAMKLPVDLSDPMPGMIDQKAKIGSMAFMCTMMANLLPSLATMDGKTLVTNMIALSLFVVTLAVNVCIQIKTDVISSGYFDTYPALFLRSPYGMKAAAAIYVGMLLMLLIVHTCSSLAILKSKHMLESRYQHVHETALKNQHRGTSSVEKLNEHVSHYWMMAGTGSLQLWIASFSTTTASGVLCALSTLLYISIVIPIIPNIQKHLLYLDSSYRWSMLVISIIQLIGVTLGTIAPFSRCFTSLSFKLSTNIILNHFNVFKVESYWTQKLSNWKQSTVPSPFRSRKGNIFIEKLKIILLNICIGFQKSFVVACKMIALIPVLIVLCAWCCSYCWKWLKAMFDPLGIMVRQRHGNMAQSEDLRQYALQIEDDTELAERTLKGISKSLNRLIQKAEKKRPNNLMRLLEVSKDFKGVGKYDNHHVSRLISKEYLDCWSLQLVSITTIAISLPEIENTIVDRLLSSVSEGLVYIRLVEEIFNASEEYVSPQKAAKLLWPGVEFNHKWHGIKLRKFDPQLNKAQHILEWFRDTAKKMVYDIESRHIRYKDDNLICMYVSADSMYRIAETILLSHHNTTEEVSQRELYDQLLSMIADIVAACLTNLPRVIMMKCHTSETEKREASVHVAAQLLGETMQIIKSLEDHEIPSLNLDELVFIGKWCAYYNNLSP